MLVRGGAERGEETLLEADIPVVERGLRGGMGARYIGMPSEAVLLLGRERSGEDMVSNPW